MKKTGGGGLGADFQPVPSKQEVSDALRDARERVRSEAFPLVRPTSYPVPSPPHAPLGSLRQGETSAEMPTSPSRERLNELWNVSVALHSAPPGLIGRWLAPLRGPLQRLLKFAWGSLVERQVELNSAQVRFDNELVEYVDHRLDRISAHYDHLLGLYGKRMEEIDERHLILQQELIRHVHELVKRIDFVFESGEQNHLYLEGMLREAREELRAIAQRMEALSQSAKR